MVASTETGQPSLRSPNEKWGPALLPAPICAERRICRCSSACPTRRSFRSSILAHQLRRRVRTWIPIRRRVPCLSRPFLDQSPFACLRPEGHRVRARKTGSSGASSGWSDLEPKFLLIAIRWRSDLQPILNFWSLPTFRRGWDIRPDHPFLMNLDPSRSKRKKHRFACG